MKLASMIAAVALAAASAGAADAAVTTYTSSAAFNAALASFTPTVENFSSGSAGQTIASGGSFNGNTYTTSGNPSLDGTIITNQFNSFTGLSLGGNQSGSAQFFFSGDHVTVTFAAPVFAVGAFFNVNADSGNFGVTVGGDTASADSATYDTSTFVFAGLVSDTSFNSATFFSSDGGAGTASFNIPEIISVAAGVPEPASWAMMLMGFGGLGAVLRRRRPPAVTATA